MDIITAKEISKSKKRKTVSRNAQSDKKMEDALASSPKNRKHFAKTEPEKVKEATQDYLLPPSELERVKHKVGFNGLPPNQWALLSKNGWMI